MQFCFLCFIFIRYSIWCHQMWINFITCFKLTVSLTRTQMRSSQTLEKMTYHLQSLAMPCSRKASSPRSTPGPQGPLHSWNSHHSLYYKHRADATNWLGNPRVFSFQTDFILFSLWSFFMNFLGKYKGEECTSLYKCLCMIFNLFPVVLHKL